MDTHRERNTERNTDNPVDKHMNRDMAAGMNTTMDIAMDSATVSATDTSTDSSMNSATGTTPRIDIGTEMGDHMDPNPQQTLLARIVAFCERHEDIRALILIGSQARTDLPADPYSDLDLVLIARHSDAFLDTDAWVREIAPFHVSFVEPTIGGERERRILFEGALDVDFLVLSAERAQEIMDSEEAAVLVRRGFRFLVNKDGYAMRESGLAPSAGYQPPTANEFANVVNDFWYHTVWTGKKLLRGELWAAHSCVDGYMKGKLLWMMEHHAHAVHGPAFDTWYGGRHLDRWADPEVRGVLAVTFSRYHREDMACALQATMCLFRTLAEQTAHAYGFDYPRQADAYCTEWVHEQFGEEPI